MTTVSHVSRRLLMDWTWREGLASTDPLHRRAAECVARDVRIASDWLLRQSEALGFRLPLGNGTNGAWNRVPLLDSRGCLAIADIAKGVVYYSDAHAPSVVGRFLVRTDKALSPHPAGETGGVPTDCQQIAAGLMGLGKSRSPIDTTARIVRVVYGLRTCYDTINSRESVERWWQTFPADRPLLAAECEWIATTEPQTVRWSNVHIPREVYDSFATFCNRRSLYPGQDGWQAWHDSHARECSYRMSWRLSYSCVLGDIRITGTRGERNEAEKFLEREWQEFCEWRVSCAAEAERQLLRRGYSDALGRPPLRLVERR